MKTTIYLVRHSKPLFEIIERENTTEEAFIINKKLPLSIEGEKLAEEISKKKEFSNLDKIYTSSYTRAMSTSKYFAHENNLKINIEEDLGERKVGVKHFDDVPENFELHQFEDENYKIGDGESRKEVQERLTKMLTKILNDNKGKRVLVVGHATSTTYLLMNWCDIKYESTYSFKGKPFFDGKWNYCQSFKLEFEDNELINIFGC